MIPVNDHGRTTATAPLAIVGPAVVGAFGWLLAHCLTFWLIAHSHRGDLSPLARHVHDSSAAAAVIAGCLAAACLIAVALTSTPGAARATPTPRQRRRTFQLAVGLSTGGFLLADTVEHVVVGLERTPPTVVLLGAALHALIGAASSLFWLHYTDSVHHLLRARARLDGLPALRPGPASTGPHLRRTNLWAYTFAGRAPPAATA